MPSILPTRMPQKMPSQADLDALALLTSESSILGPLSPERKPNLPLKKSKPVRDSPLDALLISAVLAGSGPVTRHHFGHGCGKSR